MTERDVDSEFLSKSKQMQNYKILVSYNLAQNCTFYMLFVHFHIQNLAKSQFIVFSFEQNRNNSNNRDIDLLVI